MSHIAEGISTIEARCLYSMDLQKTSMNMERAEPMVL